MTTTTIKNVNVATTNKPQKAGDGMWPKGSLKTMFGLFAACVIGAGLVLLGVAELAITLA